MKNAHKPNVLRGGMIGVAPSIWSNDGNTVTCQVSLCADEHIYLFDHQINGRPVLPATFALNMLCEAASAAFPNLLFNSVKDFRVLSGIVIDERKTVFVELAVADQGKSLNAKVYSKQPKFRPHFSASFGCNSAVSIESVDFDLSFWSKLKQISAKEIYSSLLFHGEIFQGVRFATIVDDSTVYGVVCGVPPLMLRSKFSGFNWFIDPVALDCAMQIAAVLTNSVLHKTVLPTGFKQLEILEEFGQQRIHVCVQFIEPISENTLVCNLTAFDEQNKVIFRISELEGLPIKQKLSL